MKMTNEQAIDIIEKMCFKVAVNSPAQDALTMADMALQNQPKWKQALNNACNDIDGLVSEMNCEPHWIQRRSVSDYMEDAEIEVSE